MAHRDNDYIYHYELEEILHRGRLPDADAWETPRTFVPIFAVMDADSREPEVVREAEFRVHRDVEGRAWWACHTPVVVGGPR